MKYLVLGNWKSNGTKEQISPFLGPFSWAQGREEALALGLALPFHLLGQAEDRAPLLLGAQNVSAYPEGAYTGEITATMLAATGTQFCIVGHSERRHYFGETVAQTAEKLERLLTHGIYPVLCIGESQEQREAGQLEAVLVAQLAALKGLSAQAAFAIAYEPIWAIGTGVAAATEDVAEAHRLIKRTVAELGFGEVPVLYGGSVKPESARELAAIESVSGFLVGNASLEPDSFQAIAREFCQGKHLF